MLFCAPISTRLQFPKLLAELGLAGPEAVALEVGTHRGDYAAAFMGLGWPGRLVCVDPWSVPPGYEHQADILRAHLGGADDRRDDLRTARQALGKWKDRVSFVVTTSASAAPQFEDGSLAFVYLDGDHRLDAVRLDLQLWWPKLAPGGLLAGHDFLCPGEPDGCWGRFVQQAVNVFAHHGGLDVNVVVEEGGLPWSFYIAKPRR